MTHKKETSKKKIEIAQNVCRTIMQYYIQQNAYESVYASKWKEYAN